MINKRDLISSRVYSKEDEPFIFSTWLKGLRYGNEWFGRIEQESYFKNYHDVVDRILRKSSTRVSISCLVDDPDVILAYCVYDDKTLHWVYVKPDWRGIGLARDLMPKDIDKVTHLTNVGYKIMKDIRFDPFTL